MREYIVPIYDDSTDHDEIFVGYIRENAAEIVRCEDCISYDDNGRICQRHEEFIDQNGYCNYGKRRTDE